MTRSSSEEQDRSAALCATNYHPVARTRLRGAVARKRNACRFVAEYVFLAQ